MGSDDATPDSREVLEQARQRCLTLLDDLRRQALELQRPSRAVSDDVLAQGRAVHDLDES
jgi:hypothetical protein